MSHLSKPSLYLSKIQFRMCLHQIHKLWNHGNSKGQPSKTTQRLTRWPTTCQALTQSPDDATEASGLAEEYHVKTVFLNRGTEEDLPKNFDEAISGIEADQWKQAMDEEMENLRVMGTWIKKELPLGRKVVGCRWVYVRKRDKHGAIIKHKAWLVAQGFFSETWNLLFQQWHVCTCYVIWNTPDHAGTLSH